MLKSYKKKFNALFNVYTTEQIFLTFTFGNLIQSEYTEFQKKSDTCEEDFIKIGYETR